MKLCNFSLDHTMSLIYCRASDKVKKGPTNYYKKVTPPNHHSSTISPQPILQTEKTSLHDKQLNYDKPKRKSKDDGKGGFLLPEVRGAEGKRILINFENL